jgi:outer membrane protein TolC
MLLAGALMPLSERPALSQDAAPATGGAPLLTLEEALTMAAANNRQVASARLEVGKASDRIGALKAQRLPALSLNATVGRQLNTVEFTVEQGIFGDYPGTGPIPGTDTVITSPPDWTSLGLASLNQPLSQLYKIGLGVRAREELLAAAHEDMRATSQSVTRQVRLAYYAILSAESALSSARESLALSREVHRVLGDRLVVKAALAHDEQRSRAAVVQAEYDVASLETVIANSREQLNVLLARDPATPFRLAPLAEPASLAEDETTAAARAAERRPEVRRARYQASASCFDTKLAKAEYLPDVSLTLNYFSPWDLEFQVKSLWTAGVLVRWDVFDGGKRAKELAEKRKTEEQARIAVEETEAAMRVEARHNWRKLQDSQRLIEAALMARNATRDQLRVTRARYEAEASLAKDLLQAQSDLAQADHQYIQALVSYWSTRADYETSIGEDL